MLKYVIDSLRAERSGDRIPVGGGIYRTRPEQPWEPHSLLYNWYRVSFLGVKRPGRGAGHPPPSSAEVKKNYSYTSTPPSGPSRQVTGLTLLFKQVAVYIHQQLCLKELTVLNIFMSSK
jgi:hypothetical protein